MAAGERRLDCRGQAEIHPKCAGLATYHPLQAPRRPKHFSGAQDIWEAPQNNSKGAAGIAKDAANISKAPQTIQHVRQECPKHQRIAQNAHSFTKGGPMSVPGPTREDKISQDRPMTRQEAKRRPRISQCSQTSALHQPDISPTSARRHPDVSNARQCHAAVSPSMPGSEKSQRFKKKTGAKKLSQAICPQAHAAMPDSAFRREPA
jgi:hypothetical protein